MTRTTSEVLADTVSHPQLTIKTSELAKEITNALLTSPQIREASQMFLQTTFRDPETVKALNSVVAAVVRDPEVRAARQARWGSHDSLIDAEHPFASLIDRSARPSPSF